MSAATLPPTNAWPDPASIPIKGNKYLTPDGAFGRVTTIAKAYGGGVEGLIKWSATLERAAVLEAIGEVVSEGSADSPDAYMQAVEAKLGKTRAHQRALQKAGDIGTAAHEGVRHDLNAELGIKTPMPKLGPESALAFTSWRAWRASKPWLRSVRVEQPIWHKDWGYAGTIDWIAEDTRDGVLEVWDWKSSKGIYEAHHMQVAAYVLAANRWATCRPGGIVRLPKDATGPLEVEERTLGHMYDGRKLTLEQLLEAFHCCTILHRLFVATEE